MGDGGAIRERTSTMDGINGFNGLGDFQLKAPEISLPEMPDMPNWYMWSDTQFELIKQYIKEFEDSLDPEHEVGLLLTNFGQSVLMQVTEIGYEKSVMLVFKGTVNGRPATLIQHINQLNFLLTSVDRMEQDKPKQKIGFRMPDEE